MQIQLLNGKVHCLASYKVAAWQRDLDTPLGNQKGKKGLTLANTFLTLGYHQLIHENTGGKSPNAKGVRIQSPA